MPNAYPGSAGAALSGSTQPILPGFHPDPTICRVGPDYYLATSSFEYFPGVPLFHSADLLAWRQIGHILSRPSQFGADRAPSAGIYAGTLRHRDGRFWFITTNVSDFHAGQLLVSATDPAGPWSEPVFVPEAIGIDPDLAWDDDGVCYLTWKAMDFTTETGILQAPLDLMTGQLLAEPYQVWQGSGMDAAEGPHLYRIGDWWYLVLAEGGTERGHSVTVARGSHPYGPFDPHPQNPIFSRRSLIESPVQSVGHADLVQTVDGEWAAVYLGARPRGSTPGFHVLGRETFLAGVDWSDGWPSFVEHRFEVPGPDTAFHEEFSGESLSDRWVTPGGDLEGVAERHPLGGLALQSAPDGSPGMICTRVRDLRWEAEAVVTGSGRFLVRIDDRHWYGLVFEDGAVRGVAHVGELRYDVGSVPALDPTVTLRLRAVAPSTAPVPFGHAGPDEIEFSVGINGERQILGRLDGRYVSTEVASGFTGRMLALSSVGSGGRFLSLRYRPADRATS